MAQLVKAWNLTRSKEDSGTQSYGVPTRQGNYEIFPRYDRYSAFSAHLTAPLSALTHQAVDYKPSKVHFEISTD